MRTRPVCRVWKKLSIGSLSQQSPLRLIEGVTLDRAKADRQALAGYCMPRLEWWIRAGGRPLALDGHMQSVEGDLDAQRRAHAPADSLASEEVEQGGEVQRS